MEKTEKTRQDTVKALMQCYDLRECAEKNGLYMFFNLHVGEEYNCFDIWLTTQGSSYENILHFNEVNEEDVDSKVKQFYEAIEKHKNQ